MTRGQSGDRSGRAPDAGTPSVVLSRFFAVPASQNLRFEHFELQLQERHLLVDHRSVAVGARAFDLLLALVERRDRIVSKNELLDIVWPGLVVEENNLKVHISTLRKLLGPQVIATIPGRGYRFTEMPLGKGSDIPPEGTAACELPPPQRSPDALTNLPPELTVLYGRDADLVAIRHLLRAHNLVSIVGAPGIGKTRLA